MPVPNNPATARVALTVTRDTRKFVNVFHMQRADGGVLAVADLLNMANTVADWWLNSYRHQNTTQIVGESVVATKLDPADPIQQTVFIAAPGDLAGAQADPADVTAATSWRTGLAGRKYRGRFYFFGINGLGINLNDTIQGGVLTALTAIGNYLLTHLTTNSLKLVIFHRASNTATAVTSLVIDQLVDSMRTRLAGRGI